MTDKMSKMENGKVGSGIPEPPEKEKPFGPITWKALLIVGVFIYGSYTILVHLCEVDGRMPFSSASSVLTTEILKLILSIGMFIPEAREKGFERPSVMFIIPFSVPAILYCINNNVAVHMQLQMDPATYQVLGNLKIFSTAILYRLIIKRPITGMQWVALTLLAIAGACNSYGGLKASPEAVSAGEIHLTVKGLIMISCYCFISGLSGVYTEFILKKKYETSIHIQNGLLYIFGIILNGSVWLVSSVRSDEADSLNLFKGYSIYTWILVITQAFSGLIMSAIMKHGNNITRLFLISCAMLVTTVFAILIFHLKLNVYFCLAFVLVITALKLYHSN